MKVQHEFTSEAGAREAHLRIIAFTDLHMRLLPYDHVAGKPVSGCSLALAATEADAARQEAANSLLFDLGDAYEGSPIDQDLMRLQGEDAHPMSSALCAAGVEASTLGNHDFNHGLAPVERLVAASKVPVVLSNIVRRLGAVPLDDTPFLPPSLILDRRVLCGDGTERAVRIGLIGVAPPQTLEWDREQIGDALVARDIVETVEAWAADLRQRGADIVVVLCHSGIGPMQSSPMMENAAVPVAAVDGVDAVLSGHMHGMFPHPAFDVGEEGAGIVDPAAGRIHGKPVVMPGFWGSHIGIVDLHLSGMAGGGWTIARSAAEIRPVRASVPHPGVMAAVADFDRAIRRAVRQPIARSVGPLDSYFARVADNRSVRIVNEAQAAYVRSALTGDDAALPVLAANAPMKSGGPQTPDSYTDIPEGPLLLRHLVDLYMYQNGIAALRLSGGGLKAWLERSAGAFHRIETGARDAPLLDPNHPGYNFDVISGVTYRIDLSQPAVFDTQGIPVSHGGKGRIVDLRFEGRPVVDGDAFVLATNTYRLGRGGGFPVPEGARLDIGPIVSVRDVLARHLEHAEAAGGPLVPAWGFVPQAGTTAVFETGPGAAHVSAPGADAPGGPVLSPVSATDAGTMLYRIDLSRAGVLGPSEQPVRP